SALRGTVFQTASDAVAVGVDEREVAVADQLLQLLRPLQGLELGRLAEQASDVDRSTILGALRCLMPLRDIERYLRPLVTLRDRSRRQPAPCPLARRQDG